LNASKAPSNVHLANTTTSAPATARTATDNKPKQVEKKKTDVAEREERREINKRIPI